MSLNRDQFAIVLATLRSRFRDGEWVEGEPLTVADIATECGVSATPVREALARLAGEGLVEDRRGRGYHARRIDVVDLGDLYRAQHILTETGIAAAAGTQAGPLLEFHPSPEDFLTEPVRVWEGLFDALVRQANNSFLMSEQRRLADRLAPARRQEPRVLGEGVADYGPLATAISGLDWAALGALLKSFSRRRKAAVEALVIAMRLASPKYKASI